MMYLYRNESDRVAVQQLPVSSCRNTCKCVYFPVSIEISAKKPKKHPTQHIGGNIDRSSVKGFEPWEHLQYLCCSIGLQWPNPYNKESLILTLSAVKDGKTCQLPEHDILPVIPLFFFSGVTLARRAALTCLFHCAENRGGVMFNWSQLAANMQYHYCSLFSL